MPNKLKQKIRLKRGSRNLFWKIIFFIKDLTGNALLKVKVFSTKTVALAEINKARFLTSIYFLSNHKAYPNSKKILLITDIFELKNRMDKSHWYWQNELDKYENVILFGPGHPRYKRELTVQNAVKIFYGKNQPDFIIHDLVLGAVPESILVKNLENTKIPKIMMFDDTWDKKENMYNFLNKLRFNFTFLTYKNYIPEFQENCPTVEFFWLPHSVNTKLFKDYKLPKKYDVLLYGNLDEYYYPFRLRLKNILSNVKEISFLHIKHPGYQICCAGKAISGSKLSKLINQSRITISDKSINNCLFMKYFEIAASNSAIAGIVPDYAQNIFKNNFINLNEQMTDEEIEEKLKKYLSDKKLLRQISENARMEVTQNYSIKKSAELFMKKIDSLKRC